MAFFLALLVCIYLTSLPVYALIYAVLTTLYWPSGNGRSTLDPMMLLIALINLISISHLTILLFTSPALVAF